MRIFHQLGARIPSAFFRFVRVGGPMARLTKMYDTSPESWVLGAVYRLPLMVMAMRCFEYKSKSITTFNLIKSQPL